LPLLERAYRIFPDAEIASHWGEATVGHGKQSEARALWARRCSAAPESKPLRATIERLTGTKLEPRRSGEPEIARQPENRRAHCSPRPPPRVASRARQRSARRGWPRWLAAGCRTLPPGAAVGPGAEAPWPEQRAALEKLDRYALNGRVAVAAQRAGVLRQPAYHSSLATGRTWRSTDRWASAGCAWSSMARDPRSRPAAAKSSMARLRATSSSAGSDSQLPLSELRWWLLGIPAPGEASVNQDAGSGEIQDFTQSGWRVSINTRAAGLGFSLPQAAHRRARGRAPQAAGENVAVTEMPPISFSAPAKLNLMLHVVGRRADGYHELQTVFQLIDLCDRIEIRVRDDGVHCAAERAAGIPESEDLVVGRRGRCNRRPEPRSGPKSP
jgi:hypothetical protein